MAELGGPFAPVLTHEEDSPIPLPRLAFRPGPDVATVSPDLLTFVVTGSSRC